MVREYAERYYAPAIGAFRRRTADDVRLGKRLSSWSDELRSRWQQIHFGTPEISTTSDAFRFRVAVYLGEVKRDSVAVELFADADGAGDPVRITMARDGELQGATNAHAYEATIVTARSAADFTARVVPYHPEAVLPSELPLILWQR
jgi:starch phosphorylase